MKMMAMIILFLLTLTASSHPEEARGVVTRIIDGSAFEVSELSRVRLEDVASVSANNANGTAYLKKNFNRMYVNAGYGMLKDDPKTEFDPASW